MADAPSLPGVLAACAESPTAPSWLVRAAGETRTATIAIVLGWNRVRQEVGMAVRVGVIGTGLMGGIHARAAQDAAGSELVAVGGGTRAAALGARLGGAGGGDRGPPRSGRAWA